jgi:hypothetical protein
MIDILLASNFYKKKKKKIKYICEIEWDMEKATFYRDKENIKHIDFDSFNEFVKPILKGCNLTEVKDSEFSIPLLTEPTFDYAKLKRILLKAVKTDNTYNYKFYLNEEGIYIWNDKERLFYDDSWEEFIENLFKTFNVKVKEI